MELSWGHNDPICHILNKSPQAEDKKKKVLEILHQCWKQPGLVLAITSKTAVLSE